MIKKKILLTYGWCRSSYTALRSLHKLGNNVIMSDSNKIGMSQSSRLKYEFIKYTSPLESQTKFISDILQILEENKCEFLFPVHDETVTLSYYRDHLPRNVILPINTYEYLELANDKNKMADYAENLGLPVPGKIHWHKIEDLELKLLN